MNTWKKGYNDTMHLSLEHGVELSLSKHRRVLSGGGIAIGSPVWVTDWIATLKLQYNGINYTKQFELNPEKDFAEPTLWGLMEAKAVKAAKEHLTTLSALAVLALAELE